MKIPKAKKDFNIDGKLFFTRGDDVKIQDKNLIIKLNELGYIEPLTIKDIQEIGKEEPKNKKTKEEE